jgi:serine/threonine protein kinase
MVGTQLLHYEIVEKLGQGGMGEVYRARDTKLDRDVALKILPTDMANDPERRMRFEREAKAVATLKHPNIVTIHSVEAEGGSHFITMELVEGETLADMIPRDGMNVDTFFQVAVPLTEALTSAHNKGITHRDLKPANVMMGDDGQLKVLDFGLAKLLESPEADLAKTVAGESATAEGKILGTVAYMAPEQAEGKPVDPRSDVFSLGVIFYEMATGERPFKGDTSISTISSILREDPPSVTELNKGVPRHLSRIVKRSLAKDPDRRYQSAHDLRNDLLELKEEIDSGELQVPTSEALPIGASSSARKTALWAAVGAVVVVGGLIGVLQLTGMDSDAPEPQQTAASMEITRLTTTGKSIEAAISPDGRYVAHVLLDEGKSSLWVTQVSTSSSVEIVPPNEDGLWDPIFSSTGEFIHFIRGGEPYPDLYRVPVLGGGSRLIAKHVNQTITFSPDGERIGFLRSAPLEGHIIVANADGTGERVLVTRKEPEYFSENPAWSPDGSTMAVSVGHRGRFNEEHVVGISLEDGSVKRLSNRNWIDVGEIAWYPDGSELVLMAAEDILTTHLWELSYPSGETRRITNDVNTYNGISLTADGEVMAIGMDEASFTLWVATPGSNEDPRQITHGTRIDEGDGLVWAPDGSIVYQSSAGGTVQIWSVNPDGSNQRRITSEYLNGAPQITPDGGEMVFASVRSGKVNIWKGNREAGNAVALTDVVLAVPFGISPDGEWIISQDFGQGIVVKMPIGGGDMIPISDRRANSPVISPDGQLIAVRSWDEELEKNRTYILPFEEPGPPVAVLDIPSGNHSWSPGGTAITYVDDKSGVDNIWSQPLDGSPPTQLTYFRDLSIQQFDWSPDGKRVVMSRGETTFDVVLLRNFR